MTSAEDRIHDKVRMVVEYLQFREAPTDLKRRVKRHYTSCWRRSPAPFAEAQVSAIGFSLPPSLSPPSLSAACHPTRNGAKGGEGERDYRQCRKPPPPAGESAAGIHSCHSASVSQVFPLQQPVLS